MAQGTQSLYQPRGVGWGGIWREILKGREICMLMADLYEVW